MQISVSGKKFSVGNALSEHAKNNLDGAVSKYFDRAIDGDIVFSKEAHNIVVNIVVNEGTGNGISIKGEAKAEDAYAAFDKAAERVEKQLRRYKRRLKNHHKKEHAAQQAAVVATKYIISDKDENVEQEENPPLIIAEKALQIETLTVSEAVMRMNLADLPALMFVNKKGGGVNIVYHRKDGNITWVDSDLKTEEAA